ncbi:MAG: hypothetical protein JWP80_3088 [Pseudomonas sp.]|nr:hypothetical protein [Pseudomonas sp.]
MTFRTPFFSSFAIAAMALACMSPVQAAPGSAMRDCRPDYQKFCSTVERGDGRAVECLKQHQAELSPACATDMKAMVENAKDRVLSSATSKPQ